MTGIVPRVAATGIVIGIAAAVVMPSTAVAEDPEPGEQLCEITDERLNELSGLAALPDGGYLAISDGSRDQTVVDVFQLDESCTITGGYTAPNEPWDPEDLAVDDNGMIWVADIGDNGVERATAAIHRIDPQTGASAIYRFTYPDGPHDAEALLVPPDGLPIFVTKGLGESTLYRATAQLDPNNPDGGQLEDVGTITIEATDTPGGPQEVGGVPLSGAPSIMITGGAVSLEGDRVVLRTYTDAYEWEVTDGDVVAAITGDTEPVRTPLPDEPQGEAITYGPDGQFVTGSEAVTAADGTFTPAALWQYEPAVAAAEGDEGGQAADGDSGSSSGFVDFIIGTLGADGIILALYGIGVIGAVIFVIGLLVVLRARARRHAAEAEDADLDGGDDASRMGAGRSLGEPGDPDDRFPDGRHPDDRFPDGRHPDDRFPDGGYPDGRFPDGRHPDDRYPDDGLSGGRLFEPVRRDDDEFRDWPNRGPSRGDGHDHRPEGRTGTVYGGQRDRRDDGGTVYGGHNY